MSRKKHGNCPRCGMMNRRKMCNDLGDYRVFAATVEHVLESERNCEQAVAKLLEELKTFHEIVQ